MNERELKFRIYAHIDKAFIYFDIEDYPSGIAMGVSAPQQFTGLLDSQGKEIYEGDIVINNSRDWYGHVEISPFSGAQICDKNTDWKLPIGLYDSNLERQDPDLIYTTFQCADIEIIGNTIQNPELLK